MINNKVTKAQKKKKKERKKETQMSFYFNRKLSLLNETQNTEIQQFGVSHKHVTLRTLLGKCSNPRASRVVQR